MPARKFDKAFPRRCAMREIGLQDSLNGLRRILGLHVAIELAPKRGVGAKTATDQHVIALDRISLLVVLHLAGQQPDFRNEMLRAGMMAAGEVDIDRRVECDARLAPTGDLLGMALGVGGGKLAAGIAGAGDET